MIMELINDDILIHILSFLPFNDKMNSKLVCKSWYNINKYIFNNTIIKVNYKQLKNNKFKKWYQHHKQIKFEYINYNEYRINFSLFNLYKTSMYNITIYCDDIYEIPYEITNLKNLRKLILCGNNFINKIPEFITQLEHLKILKLSRNRIITISENIGELYNLKHLELDSNEITYLPESIGKFKIYEFDLE